MVQIEGATLAKAISGRRRHFLRGGFCWWVRKKIWSFYAWIVFFKQSILYFTKFYSRQNIYLKLRNTGSISVFSKKNLVFPAVDILGTIIALKWPVNKGVFMPTAQPMEFDCSSKPVMFHWNVTTLPGIMGGVT